MTNKTIKLTLLASSMMFGFAAQASSSVSDRVVVSVVVPQADISLAVKSAKGEQGGAIPSTLSRGSECLNIGSGESWCVPVVRRNGQTLRAERDVSRTQGTGKKLQKLMSFPVELPAGVSSEQAITILNASGLYYAVEPDYKVEMQDIGPASWNATIPTDLHDNSQRHFRTNSPENPIESSILDMWQLINNPTKEVSVYVFDGGFRLHQDIKYASGVNMVVENGYADRNDKYLETDHKSWEECKSSHGLQVASVIGAGINDGFIAGMVGDVNIHPVRVLNCRNGYLSDVAFGLAWLSDSDPALYEQSPDLPRFNGKPGIINMSLGGLTNGCPGYLQNAINVAIEKGYTIVTAAGNDNDLANKHSPGNCDGVINVGAANMLSDKAERASFSNYGEAVDTWARGTSVGALSITNETEEDRVFASGTSLAAPIVSGLLALLSKDFNVDIELAELLVPISSVERWSPLGSCALDDCSPGILVGSLLYENAVKYQLGELNSVSYVLDALSPCRQKWAIDNLTPGKALCDQVKLTLAGLRSKRVTQEYRVIKVDKGADIATSLSSAELIGNFDKREPRVTREALLGGDVYAQICTIGTEECTEPMIVDTDNLAELPAVCQD